MVVVGIIAILGAIAVPGFKKIYGDFMAMRAYDTVNTLLSAMRSFYLIYNEGPEAYSDNIIEGRMIPLLSGKWVSNLTFYRTYNGREQYRADPAREILRSFSGISANLVYRILGYQHNFFIAYFDKTKRHYYWDILGDMFKKKGYRVYEVEQSDRGYVYFKLPENTPNDVVWFR